MTATATRTTVPVTAKTQGTLREVIRSDGHQDDVTITVAGHTVRLEQTVATAVVDVLERLSRGQTVTVSSFEDLLTTSQAAVMMGVSRTFVCNLLNDGRLKFEYRGTHRRVPVSEVLAYLDTQRETRRQALEEVQEISRAAGQYEDDGF